MSQEKTHKFTSLIVSIIAILTAISSGVLSVAEIRTENAVQNAKINALTENIADIKSSSLRTNEKLEQIYLMIARQNYARKED